MGAMLRRLGLGFARFVGMAVMLTGAWIFLVNLVEGPRTNGWGVYAWILGSGMAGALGGLAFLLSFDGPDRFRNRTIRSAGWLTMLASLALPHTLGFFLIPLVFLVLPWLLIPPGRAETEETSITSG